jgi:hypothetical protein
MLTRWILDNAKPDDEDVIAAPPHLAQLIVDRANDMLGEQTPTTGRGGSGLNLLQIIRPSWTPHFAVESGDGYEADAEAVVAGSFSALACKRAVAEIVRTEQGDGDVRVEKRADVEGVNETFGDVDVWHPAYFDLSNGGAGHHPHMSQMLARWYASSVMRVVWDPRQFGVRVQHIRCAIYVPDKDTQQSNSTEAAETTSFAGQVIRRFDLCPPKVAIAPKSERRRVVLTRGALWCALRGEMRVPHTLPLLVEYRLCPGWSTRSALMSDPRRPPLPDLVLGYGVPNFEVGLERCARQVCPSRFPPDLVKTICDHFPRTQRRKVSLECYLTASLIAAARRGPRHNSAVSWWLFDCNQAIRSKLGGDEWFVEALWSAAQGGSESGGSQNTSAPPATPATTTHRRFVLDNLLQQLRRIISHWRLETLCLGCLGQLGCEQSDLRVALTQCVPFAPDVCAKVTGIAWRASVDDILPDCISPRLVSRIRKYGAWYKLVETPHLQFSMSPETGEQEVSKRVAPES